MLNTDELFTYIRPTEKSVEGTAAVRDLCRELARQLTLLAPESDDRTDAIRKLHDFNMAAYFAIVHHQEAEPVVEPPPPPVRGWTFDPESPAVLQTDDWQCSAASLAWALSSVGRPTTQDQAIEILGARINPAVGLVQGDGSGLAVALREQGLPGNHASPIDFDSVLAEAGNRPILIGGAAWNHWSGVSGCFGSTLSLRNPAPGYKGIFSTLEREQFEALGPFAAVWLEDGAVTEPVAPADPDPWKFFSAHQIAATCGADRGAVEANWPHIAWALEKLGIRSRECEAAALATVAIETASTFEPVREAFWLDEEYRRNNFRYYPYYGRGYVQLTWESNYKHYGILIGQDLANNPDLAMEPSAAAWVLAYYFRDRGVDDAANQRDWGEVRRRVQGAHAGLPRLVTICKALLD